MVWRAFVPGRERGTAASLSHPASRRLSPAPTFLNPIRMFMTPTLAAAVAVGIAVLPARAAAGTLASVTPLGASPGIVVRVTGTGFAAEAASNEVLLRSGAGSEARVTPTEVTTLDAAKGLRRLAFTMPGSLPAGAASIAVTNLATGEVSAGRNIEVITIALSLSSAERGASDLQIRVSGSPNCQFVAGRTMVTFGPGVTINGLSVESPATLVARVTVDAAAAPGPRTVQVISSLHQAVLPGGFTVTVSPRRINRPRSSRGPAGRSRCR